MATHSNTLLENHIGTVLYRREDAIESELRKWRKLLPFIQEIAAGYLELTKEKLSLADFLRLINGNYSDVVKKVYAPLQDSGLKGVSGEILRKMMKTPLDTQLEHFTALCKKFNDARYQEERGASYRYVLDVESDICFENGGISINAETIEKRNSVIIETEEQNELYNHMLELRASWDKLRSFLISKGFDVNLFRISSMAGNSLVYENDSCELVFHNYAIKHI